MEGADTRTILEYLIICLKNEEERQLKGLALEGIVLVSSNLSDSTRGASQLRCTTTIAAAGNFCSKILSEQFWKEMDGMLAELSVPWTRPWTAGGCSHEPLDSTALQLAFELHERPGVLMMDCLAVKQFIHKISMVHPKIRFHYCVNVNGAVSAETYCGEKRESTCILNGIKLLTDQRHYIRVADSLVSYGANFLCDKIHPVLGKAVSLLIPHEVAETGFTGELEVTPAAALCPCLKLYPNQPAKIAAVSIFFYDPAGLPISFNAKGKSSLFFNDPSNLAEWEKYSYSATLDSDPGQEEDQVNPDVRYKLHWDGGSQEDDPDTWEQTLLLFLFLHYSDQFQDKPLYDFWTRHMIASHMDQILLCSQETVKHGVQAVIDAMLQEHCKRGKNQRRLKLSLPIILGAISSVVSSSTNSQFRRECLQSLQQVPEDANPAWLTACDLPTAGQKLAQEEASDSINSVNSEPASLEDRADLWGEMSETKRRKTATMENNAGGALEQEPLSGLQERTDDLMTDFGSQLSFCLWSPKEGADASMFLGEREEGFTAVSEDRASSSENLWQVGQGRSSPEIKLGLSKREGSNWMALTRPCSPALRGGVAWRKERGLQNQLVLSSNVSSLSTSLSLSAKWG
ncbi:type 2 DNA topoisomerase 6 subunit B-like isoform X2 [Gopherus evgoodei]|uniref:type 2 DNA topoisomerase 6 subunit B-like isoform X2 n=1 Tax=Gopherus evgoodei TaxID=1825980 RepID=UPI0011CF9C48|nr:type 2 DNA topoisomerase 6 subunit B-like isoform X2 [Gopherus evgoodei]